MRRLARLICVVSVLTACATPAPVTAGGYLWLGAEFQGEGNIYRFNIDTGMIDLVQAHAGADHWNNMAADGTSLYLGHPVLSVLNVHDAVTGAFVSSGSYSPGLGGHKEDGAFYDGSLWRSTFSGAELVHRTTTAGVAETSFTGSNPGLVGIEFVGDTLFATAYSALTIGTLDRTGATTMQYTARPWATGEQPQGSHAALAYDADAGDLYMTTLAGRLYKVTFAGGEAFSEEVVDLATVGYPSGGLADGMSWVSNQTVSVPAPPRDAPADLELGTPWPNPARDAVYFDLRLDAPASVRVGIYDVSGRAHRVWNLPGLGAGNSRFMWDFRGADGLRVPAGQYFVRVSSAGGDVSRPVTRVE